MFCLLSVFRQDYIVILKCKYFKANCQYASVVFEEIDSIQLNIWNKLSPLSVIFEIIWYYEAKYAK